MRPPKFLADWPLVDSHRFHRWLVAFFICILTGILDQVTKSLALHFLSGNAAPRPILGNLVTLHLTRNPGAALSIGNEKTLLVSILSLIILLAVTVVTLLTPNRAWAYTLALIAGGGYGNLIDRAYGTPWGTGTVTDFIDYCGLFVGNVADIFIVIGVIIAFMLMLRNVPLMRPCLCAGDNTKEGAKNPLVPDEPTVEDTQ